MEQPMDHTTGEASATGAVKGPRRDRIAPRSASWLAWGPWLLVVLVEVLVIAFLLANHALSTYERIGALATWIPFLAFATVGAVILARRPSNRIGWLCWAIGFAITVSFWGSRQVWAVLAATQGRSSAWVLLTQLGTMAWLGTLLGLLPFLVLLFPTGRLLSPRWRPVAWAIGLVLGLYLTARLLTPGPLDPHLAGNPQNPLGVESAEGFLRLVQTLAGVTVPVLALAALARWWCGSVAPGARNASSSSGLPSWSRPISSCSQVLVGWRSGWPRRWGRWWSSQSVSR
jgi:hypothetical protein